MLLTLLLDPHLEALGPIFIIGSSLLLALLLLLGWSVRQLFKDRIGRVYGAFGLAGTLLLLALGWNSIAVAVWFVWDAVTH